MRDTEYCHGCCKDWEDGDLKEEVPDPLVQVGPPDIMHPACADYRRESYAMRDALIAENKAQHEQAMASMDRMDSSLDAIEDSLRAIESR